MSEDAPLIPANSFGQVPDYCPVTANNRRCSHGLSGAIFSQQVNVCDGYEQADAELAVYSEEGRKIALQNHDHRKRHGGQHEEFCPE